MEDKKTILSKLATVKSIVTLLLTGAFVYLAVTGEITADQFMTIFSVVIAFYFGTQYERKTSERIGTNG